MRPPSAICDTYTDSDSGGLTVSRIGVGLEDFVNACIEDRQPLAIGRAALDAQALIDAILMSSDRHATVDVADTRGHTRTSRG